MGKHSEWRKAVKKARRKRIRQQLAVELQKQLDEEQTRRENSPSYKIWLEEQERIAEFEATEETRLAEIAEQEFQDREEVAQKEWKILQVKVALAREERAKQVAKIKEEWDREQKRLKALKEEKEKIEQEKLEKQEKLQRDIEEFLNSNSEMPAQLNETLESNPGKIICPFFKKTATCRFGDGCSRNHIRPVTNSVLLIRNFYSHYSLEQTKENEHGSDSILEFEGDETYKHFKEFFEDILDELQKFGEVHQLKVCCNHEAHLRGNVYVEFNNIKEAIRCYRGLQGRWYGGKQLNVEFCNIGSWKSAICGLFYRKRCPKGSVCNFLHVFRNPGKIFQQADYDSYRAPHNSIDFEDGTNNSRNWRWSESPERYIDNHKERSSSRSNSRYNSKRSRTRSHSKHKSKRSRSKSHSHKSDRTSHYRSLSKSKERRPSSRKKS